MASSDRAAILAHKDFKTQKVDTPMWPVPHVYVRTISAGKALELAKLTQSTNGATAEAVALETNVLARIVTMCACGEDGALLFTDAGDTDAIMEKDFKTVEAIANAALEINGMKAAEGEAEKN